MRKPSKPVLIGGIAALALIGGVSSLGDNSAPAPAPAPITAPTKTVEAPAVPVPAPSPSLECLAVPAIVTEAIADGDHSGDRLEIQHAAAVRLTEQPETWIVAAQFTDTTPDTLTGVWATSSLDGSGTLFSVENYAKQFTVWPQVPGLNNASTGTRDARACLAAAK